MWIKLKNVIPKTNEIQPDCFFAINTIKYVIVVENKGKIIQYLNTEKVNIKPQKRENKLLKWRFYILL